MYAYNKSTGARIRGTREVIYCCVALTIDDGFSRQPSGEIDYDHEGETEVCWDCQETEKDDAGRALFEDADGNEVRQDEIYLTDDPEWTPEKGTDA